MTLFGVDISNENFGGPDDPNLDTVVAFVQALSGEGFSWLEAKASQGNDFIDPTFATVAATTTLPLVAYHFADASDPNQQVQNYLKAVDGAKVPCMIDFELVDDWGAALLTLGDFLKLTAAFNAVGITPALNYFPEFYWDDLGQPNLDDAGVNWLIAASWVEGNGYAYDLYPGDNSSYWGGYGGVEPVILQFTDQADVAGILVDADAFKGTQVELQTLLGVS